MKKINLFKYGVILLLLLFNYLSVAKTIIISTEKVAFTSFLNKNNIKYIIVNNEKNALDIARVNDGILFIKGSQDVPQTISKNFISKAKQLNLKVYIEYPYFLQNEGELEQRKINLERGVVISDQLPEMNPFSIFSLNDHYFYIYNNKKPLAVIAKVAGFDKAEYGIEGVDSYPLLFKETDNILVSSISLSNFNKSRFGPTEILNNIWKYIFEFTNIPHSNLGELKSDFKPTFSKNYSLADKDYKNAILKGADWYYQSKLLVHENWNHLVDKYTKKNGEGVVYPISDLQNNIGDGSLGILEGHASYIQADGSQPIRWWIRGDCQAETAFALSSVGDMLGKQEYKKTAQNLLNYLYKSSNLRAGERNDPNSTSFGLIGWATTDPDAYYGDDNARVLLATIGASTHLQTSDYYGYIIEGILGNFRTTGVQGFRGPWFRDSKLQTLKWEDLFHKDLINIHPHYECWLWANYLWLYDKTQYAPLKERAKSAITKTMEAFPQWKWTNGIQQEYARMILPLAWLVRVEDTPLHRYWLHMVTNVLLQDMDTCGAIKEKLGIPGLGRYEKVKSNQEYGLKEAPLISDYGDQVTDLLYTLNYASFGLNEAYAAVKDSVYLQALHRINDFFVKVQVTSDVHKDMDGAWVRAFDYGRWDYWASNADSGWGPWGTQTGWTQSWIINSLVSKYSASNFWDTTQRFKTDTSFIKTFEQRKTLMLNNY